MDELKPCPFCGGEAVFVSTREAPDDPQEGYCRCEKLCCEQSLVRSKENAIEDWNRRADDGKVD